MKIVVVGAGGMGGYYAAVLARAGEAVTLVAHGEHLRAIQADGLRIDGSERFTVPIRAVATPAEAGTADLVLLCVKSYDLESAARELAPLLGPETAVLALPNGVEHGERLAAIIGAEHVLAGASYIVARRAGPGLIEHSSGGRSEFGAQGALPSERVTDIQQTLRRTGIEATALHDVNLALWPISSPATGSNWRHCRAPSSVSAASLVCPRRTRSPSTPPSAPSATAPAEDEACSRALVVGLIDALHLEPDA